MTPDINDNTVWFYAVLVTALIGFIIYRDKKYNDEQKKD